MRGAFSSSPTNSNEEQKQQRRNIQTDGEILKPF